MREKKKSKKPVIILILSFLVLVGGWIFYQEKYNAVEVFSVSMLRDDWWKDFDMCTGRVISSMSQEVFSYEGREIDEIFVEVGQTVKVGDILLTFDMEEEKIDLELKEIEVKEARSALAAAAEEEKTEWEYSLKQLQLEYETLKKQIDDATVFATIDGTVKKIHSEGVNDGEPVLVVTSEDKLYIKAVVDEFNYAGVNVGSMLTAVSWDTGNTFQAKITEISTYPTEEGDYNSEYSRNPNVSYYPFCAVIVDTMADVEAGEMVNVGFDGISQKLFLPLAYIRSEGSRSYIYVRGDNNRLEKRYVTTGQSLYNTVIEIKDGLANDDYVAFPYGNNIREMANTIICEDSSKIVN